MISLIIPMYNSERTIAQTLNSVIEQTVPFSEVIVVDNGSRDRSVEIVSGICQQYPHINLLFCETQGVSAARNMGIDVSQSPYIGFLDADDFIEKNYVEVLIKSITEHPNAEMFHFNFYQQFKSGIIKQNPYFLRDKEVYNGKQFMEETLKRFSFEAKHMVWTFIFKKEFLNQYNLQFNTEMSIFEDVLFLHEAWNKSKRLIVLDTILVTYSWNEFSITNTKIQGDYIQALFHLNDHSGSNTRDRYLRKIASRVLTLKNYCDFLEVNGIYFKRCSYIKLNVCYLKQRIIQKMRGDQL